jgi:hypothetical protein
MKSFNTNKGEIILATAKDSYNISLEGKDNKFFYVHISEKSEKAFKIEKKNYKQSNLILQDNHLFVNWEDSQESHYYDVSTMNNILNIIEEKLNTFDKLVINCNWAQSRSPNIAMLFLAKKTDYFKQLLGGTQKFDKVQNEFIRQYPEYLTKTGIGKFVESNWDKF